MDFRGNSKIGDSIDTESQKDTVCPSQEQLKPAPVLDRRRAGCQERKLALSAFGGRNTGGRTLGLAGHEGYLSLVVRDCNTSTQSGQRCSAPRANCVHRWQRNDRRHLSRDSV